MGNFKKDSRTSEIPWINWLRVLACIMVVCLHSLPAVEIPEPGGRIFFQLVYAFTRPCVPLFLMITGFLLLRKQRSDIEAISFYKKRIPRVLSPLIIWGIVYAVLSYVLNKTTINDLIYELSLLPVRYPQEIGGILWYLYTLIGLYLFIPFLSYRSWSDIRYSKIFIVLWVIASLAIVFTEYDEHIFIIGPNSCRFNLLLYFSGYLGFLIFGCYLGQVKLYASRSKMIFLCGLIYSTGIIMYGGILWLNHYITHASNYYASFYSLSTILMSAGIFLAFKTLLNKRGGVYSASIVKTKLCYLSMSHDNLFTYN